MACQLVFSNWRKRKRNIGCHKNGIIVHLPKCPTLIYSWIYFSSHGRTGLKCSSLPLHLPLQKESLQHRNYALVISASSVKQRKVSSSSCKGLLNSVFLHKNTIEHLLDRIEFIIFFLISHLLFNITVFITE